MISKQKEALFTCQRGGGRIGENYCNILLNDELRLIFDPSFDELYVCDALTAKPFIHAVANFLGDETFVSFFGAAWRGSVISPEYDQQMISIDCEELSFFYLFILLFFSLFLVEQNKFS